jgi:hypothetical protein
MRNVARIKLGYYPLPSAEGSRLRRLLNFPPEPASVLDPCAGTGATLEQLTDGADTKRYAIELDAERARQATQEEGGVHLADRLCRGGADEAIWMRCRIERGTLVHHKLRISVARLYRSPESLSIFVPQQTASAGFLVCRRFTYVERTIYRLSVCPDGMEFCR